MHRFLLLFLMLLVCSAPTYSAAVADLYSAAVKVEDHSQAELKSATREALARVLVKVTGSLDAARQPELRTALSRADSYLLQYQYRGRDEALEVEVQFDENLVTRLVLDAGQPLWTANRPAVLVWLVVDSPSGRSFATSESPEGLQDFLVREFARRGVPVKFPLLDLEDAMSISAEDVWSLQTVPAMQASERYNTSDVLLGRLTGTTSGRWLGEWMYLGQGGRGEQSVYPDVLEAFAAAGADLVADTMAREFAVSGSRPVGSGLSLRVDGLAGFADYRSVVDYLESVELIGSVHPEIVSGSSVILRLQAQADAGQLRRILGLNRKLQSMDSPPPGADLPPADLEYLWSP